MWLMNIADVLYRLFLSIGSACQGFVYPPSCLFCTTLLAGDSHVVMCCPACARSLHHLEADWGGGRLTHVWFDRARSLFAYEGRVRDVLHVFKYGDRFDVVKPFASLMANEMRIMGTYDRIVPVPLHRARLSSRGFNQAAMLGRAMSVQCGVPCELDALTRIRHVGPQVGRDRADRMVAVRGIFAVRNAAAVRGMRIMLIDDILTTGATVNECARILKKAGVRSVDVLTIARTL